MKGRTIAALEHAGEGGKMDVGWYKRPLDVTMAKNMPWGRRIEIEQRTKTYQIDYSRKKGEVTMVLKRDGKEVSPDLTTDLWLDSDEVDEVTFDLELPDGITHEDVRNVCEELFWMNVYDGNKFEYDGLRDDFLAILIMIEGSPEETIEWKVHSGRMDLHESLRTAADWADEHTEFDPDIKDAVAGPDGVFQTLYKKIERGTFDIDYVLDILDLPQKVVAHSEEEAAEKVSEHMGEEVQAVVTDFDIENWQERNTGYGI